MKKPYVLFATFTPNEGRDEELYEKTKYSLEAIKDADGLMHFQFLKPHKAGGPLVFIAHWESKEHFDQAMASERAQEVHSSPKLKEMNKIMKPTANFYDLDLQAGLYN